MVFLGPTVSIAAAREVLEAEYLPPVQLGDVWRIAQERPRAIGIVDGYFHQVPAVWHKEILYAMSVGIAVYGAASMGALRAAELSTFGMIGVGEIAEQYRRGVLKSDDEVALQHAPAEFGYQGFSEPLVNIRATLQAARVAGIVSASTAEAVLAAALSLFYADRIWSRVIESSAAASDELESLTQWLPNGRIDQKRVDALAMLLKMRADMATDAARLRARPFAPTVLWREFVHEETPIAEVLDEFLLSEPLSSAVNEGMNRARLGAAVDWYGVLSVLPEWPECCRRARLKREAAAGREEERPVDEDTLLSWFFAQHLGWPSDLGDFLLARGWTDANTVLRVAQREASFMKAQVHEPYRPHP